MSFRSSSSSTRVFQAIALGVILLATYLIPKVVRWRNRMAKLNAIPTVGNSGFFSSYISARRFKDHAPEIIQEGYRKASLFYPGQAFKVPLPDRWHVIVSGEEMVNDLKKASDFDVSFDDATSETMQTEYTLGKDAKNPYTIPVVRSSLTRALPSQFHDLQDEIEASFNDLIPAKETEWMKVSMLSTVMKLVSRTSNRFFVGLPLCRDPDYVDLNINFTIDAFNGATTLRHYPGFLKPLVRQFLTNVPECMARAQKHLAPIIEERLAKEKTYGTLDWPDKPNDLITWLLDEAHVQGNGKRPEDIVTKTVHYVILVNFAAIHTTSITFTNTIYYLAANPEIADPLREEINSTLQELGWTKGAMGKMIKLDSFLKETQRLTGVSGLSMDRMVLRDFTFSNGTVVPAGTIVGTALYGLHHDEAHYDDPETFRPFRFSAVREHDGENLKHQMVAIDPSFGLFGGGRHMCPGRFFAVNEIKALIAHVLLTYDVKFEDDKGVPPPVWNGAAYSPNRSAEVMFRKRAEA
ncbi:cytochrome P450 [Rhodocollybia butyracea]|uniref:Cytochrome P450 n=1 Tax=Rhodocollybia butyracea TaxID=206335 RepID=A0A9P5PS44_9AGAR|nr:cytochrome P450 [Rhodocollybia butyracea]